MSILLALPGYDGNSNTQRTMRAAEAAHRLKHVDVASRESSLLTFNFNALWCMALNGSYTHFVMLHGDIVPRRADWLERMLELAGRVDADLLSAVVPLKLETGATSTALAKRGEFGDYRRLSVREAMSLPETFSRREVASLWKWDWKESVLLTNTGMLLVNLRKKDVLTQMCFTINDWLKRDDKGQYYPVVEPEDWHFSRTAQEKGLSVWATRAVPLTHMGGRAYENDKAWGGLDAM